MKAEKIKNGLFIFLFGLLFLPMLQQNTKIVDIDVLKGSFPIAPNSYFSKTKWFDGSYQEEKSKYLNDAFGFHEYIVRINNQIDFSLFKMTHTVDVIVGKQNYLYQSDYIKDYNRQSLLDSNRAREVLFKLKRIQDTFEAMNKTIIIVHAPSKADYFPEYLPPATNPKKGNTYRELYMYLGDSLGLHQIDFNAWFLALKPKYTNTLISRTGIHWTAFGAAFAADSLVKYTERLRHISMPHPSWSVVERVDTARGTDDDLAQIMNVIFPVAHDTFYYPCIVYDSDSTKTKPKTVYLGDSFVWTLITDGLMKNANTEWKYWNYFHDEIDQKTIDQNVWGTPIDKVDWVKSMLNADCIVLVYTSHNLDGFGSGFVEKAYDYFYPHTDNK